MEYKKGDRVRHPTQYDWGLGEVLADSSGEIVKIFFVGPGEKTIMLKHVQPEKVAIEEAKHPVLDNLKIQKTSSGIKYQNLDESIQFFLKQYPDGFSGAKYKEEERDYKFKAHMLALELLGEESISALLEKEDYAEITKRALKIVNATNMIFPNEKNGTKGWIG